MKDLEFYSIAILVGVVGTIIFASWGIYFSFKIPEYIYPPIRPSKSSKLCPQDYNKSLNPIIRKNKND